MDQRIAFVRSRDNTHIAYALSGDGAPLVKAGTWMTHLQHDWDSPVWVHWLRFLSERHTLVRYDPRGCGLSQTDVEQISLQDWVDDLEAVADRLELEHFPLLGMSQGAAVAVEYAARHPDRVSQLVLYAPLITGWRNSQHPVSQRWRMMEELALAGWGDENLAFPSMFAHLFIPGGTPEQIQWYAELQRKSASKHVAARMMNVLAELRLFHRLKDVKCPTLMMQVSDDQVIRPESAPGIASEIPGSHFASLNSRNHILLADEPAWDDFKNLFSKYIPAGKTPSSAPQADVRRLDELSQRERQILAQMARGQTNQQIADNLYISEKTVRNHVTRIFEKLDVHSRAQAIVLARDLGL
jgi:pimeloyl-ACP methyl ester carboxylesterase/DNA-binding CsgD family transcriptional regulator